MTDTDVPHRCQIWLLRPLACGHPDDDPAVWHHSDDHDAPVCADCCPTCNERAT